MASEQKSQRRPRGPGVERLREARAREGFFGAYLSGSAILDIGFRGGVPDALPVVDHAIGIELDFPGYDGTHLPFQTESQDAVFVSHCLEHIVNYREVLAEWYRVLKVGGYLIIIVPHRHLYERKATLPSRFNPDHKRFYTSGSLLAEVEEVLPVSGFRVRSLREIDTGFDYSVPPDQHAKGCYDIEVVIQRLKTPVWAEALTLPQGGRARSAIDAYARLILALDTHDITVALEMARQQCRMAETVPLPPFVVLLQQLGDQAPSIKILRGVLRLFVAAIPFDRDFYLGRYPDLMKASVSGKLLDARQHFVEHGYFEGRCGHPDDFALWLA
jgi:SAM-dependent methyltransferase